MHICTYIICMYVCMYECILLCIYVYIYLSSFRGRAIAKSLTSGRSLCSVIRDTSIHRHKKGPTTRVKSILWIIMSNSLVIFISYLFTDQFHHFLKYLTGPSKNNLTNISVIYTKREQVDELLCIVIILTEIEYKGEH